MARRKVAPTPAGAVNTDEGGRPIVDDDGRPVVDGKVATSRSRKQAADEDEGDGE